MFRNRVLSRLLPVKAQASGFETTLIFPSVENSLAPLLALLSPSREEPCSLVAPRVSSTTGLRLIPQIFCSGRAESPSAVPPNFDDSYIITEKNATGKTYFLSPK